MKYTFLSKWTVLILTAITAGLVYLGYALTLGAPSGAEHPFYAILALVGGLVVYAFGWLIALIDSIQEGKWGWTIFLILLLPIWIGPLLYSFFGPRNTK